MRYLFGVMCTIFPLKHTAIHLQFATLFYNKSTQFGPVNELKARK